MRKQKRIAASCMAAVLLSTNLTMPVKAAAPQVQVDETMYVNVDYYGKKSKINVVKGCSTNGVVQYTDYGVYDKVVNMSNDTEPVQGDGTVTWQLPKGNNRFYYQCTMPQDSFELPWDFDVSYKLNGVQADAASLAGASGLVEIRVKAEPNKKAKAYYKNNMMLSVVVPVDMEKCYSVDAPSSQLQSVGNQTMAVFAALPGEDGDFTVRIGTDSFENVGVLMMMVPATAGAFDHIKDLKEAKDTWREDGDRMYDSMNDLLKTMESMKIDVTQLKGGLNSLQNARGEVSKNRKQIEALSTRAIAELQSVTEQTTVLIPYLETARNAVSDINNNVDAIYNTMEDTQDELDTLYDRLKSLSNSLNSMSDQIERGVTAEEQQKMAQAIEEETKQIQELLGSLGQNFSSGAGTYSLTEEELEELEDALSQADSFRYDRRTKKSAKADEDEVQTEAGEVQTEAGKAQIESGKAQTEADKAQTKAGEVPTEAGEENSAGAQGSKPTEHVQTADRAQDSEAAEPSQNGSKPEDSQNTKQSSEKTEARTSAGENKSASDEKTEKSESEKQSAPPSVDDDEVQVTAFGSENSKADELVLITDRGPSGEPGSGGVNDEDFEEWSDEELDTYADGVEESLQTLSGTAYPAAVKEMLVKLSQMIGDGSQLTQATGEVIGKINTVCSEIGSTGHKTAKTLTALRGVTDELVNLLDDSRVLIDTVDGYVPSMLDSLGATEELMNRLTRAMGTTHDFLSLVNDTMISAGDSLDAGTKDSLDGMMSMLDKSLQLLDDTSAVREAGEGMKDTIDEQLDKFEEENNFLNIDPEADMVSFTSGKNPSPHSLQIVVRTDEITIDDDAVQLADMEDAESADLGPFQRMWQVLVKIVQSIIEIFKER